MAHVKIEGCGAVAAAQAQQQGNADIIPLMHSLAHFMPQMSLPGLAHSVSQPPSMMAPPQTAAHAAPVPPGFPSFVMAPSSGGLSAMPWPLMSQPPHSFQVVPPAAAAAVPAVPDSLPGPALAPATQPKDAQPAAQPAEADAKEATASEVPSSGAFGTLLEDHALNSLEAAQHEAEQGVEAKQSVQDPVVVENDND